MGYLETKNKSECFGCEACIQVCKFNAIRMVEDDEGFRYPKIDNEACVECGMCKKVCPKDCMPKKNDTNKATYGGYHKNDDIRKDSTSGGAFTAILDAWCDKDYVIFGAVADGIEVYHKYVDDKKNAVIFRKSKYAQSRIGNSFEQAKQFLKDGKKVLFTGTPCQIAGLMSFMKNVDTSKLLTIEVICEGIPSPLYIRKYKSYMESKHHSKLTELDYRHTGRGLFRWTNSGKWDFQIMKTGFENGKSVKKDRWGNPFWSIWLKHLMSRPSCYECKFTTKERVADISLGDLWGVHLYCPDLYGKNGGASLIVCNSENGKKALEAAKDNLVGRDLKFEDALRYQSPMRKSIDTNCDRELFLNDLKTLDYKSICKKWSTKPTLKLLWSKYVWGNRQKIVYWKLKNKFSISKKGEKYD